MSISSVGGGMNQSLAALLAQLTGTQTASSTAAPGSTTPSPASSPFESCSAPSGAPSDSSTNLTGSTTASVSDEILALLTQMQQQAGASAQGGATQVSAGAVSTSIGAASPSSNPLQQLMSAMDADGDGTVSETEMESYIQKQGGTAAQGDALFTALNQGGTGNLTQAQLAGDLQQGQQAQAAGAGGHHHHHHHMPPSADQVGNDLVGAMDSDGSGSVDQSEFSSFVSSLGGTASEASSDFSALDPQNTGAVTAAQFTSAINAFESASSATATNAASPILSLLDAFKQTASTNTTGATANVTA